MMIHKHSKLLQDFRLVISDVPNAPEASSFTLVGRA